MTASLKASVDGTQAIIQVNGVDKVVIDSTGIITGAGPIRQVAYAELKTSSTTTGVIPLDDTIPQITEGEEILTCSITPKSATSNLLVVCNWNLSENSNTIDAMVIGSLFRDSTAAAICAQVSGSNGLGTYAALAHGESTMQCRVPSNATTPTTIRLRVGGELAGTYRYNGAASSRRLGGVQTISIMIYEIGT